MKQDSILVTVSGPDRPGITSNLMKILSRGGSHLEDMGQAVTHGLLSLSFLIKLHADDQNGDHVLKDLLLETKKMGLSLDFELIEESSARKKGGEEFILSSVSPKGLSPQFMFEVANLFASYKINILRIDNVSRTGLKALEMRTISENGADWNKIKADLVKIGQTHSTDLAFLRSHVFRTSKRLVVLDMDSTLIQTEVIDELARAHGVYDQVKEITERAMNGHMDFRQSLTERVKMLKGLPESRLQEIAQDLPLTEGASEFIQTVKSMGLKVALITGGFLYFAQTLRNRLGLDYVFANDLEIQNGVLTGRVKGNIIDAEQKAFLMDLLAQQEHITLDQVVAVGDGANDIPMLTRAGMGIAFYAKDAVRQKADFHVGHGPMTSILSFLGIPGPF